MSDLSRRPARGRQPHTARVVYALIPIYSTSGSWTRCTAAERSLPYVAQASVYTLFYLAGVLTIGIWMFRQYGGQGVKPYGMITQQQTARREARELSKTFAISGVVKRRGRCAMSRSSRDGRSIRSAGPNGSGKSTTLKMILGCMHPTADGFMCSGTRPEMSRQRTGWDTSRGNLHLSYLTPSKRGPFSDGFSICHAGRRERTNNAGDDRTGHARKTLCRRVLQGAMAGASDWPRPSSTIPPDCARRADLRARPAGCRQIKDLILTLAKGAKRFSFPPPAGGCPKICRPHRHSLWREIRAQGPIQASPGGKRPLPD
jgi:hypothetical protein